MKINPNMWYEWDDSTIRGSDIILILNEEFSMEDFSD